MPLFYTPDIAGTTCTLSEEESKHCVRVLRLAEGDTVQLTDGRGGWYTARITTASPKRCELEVIDTQKDYEKRSYELTMAVSGTNGFWKRPRRWASTASSRSKPPVPNAARTRLIAVTS